MVFLVVLQRQNVCKTWICSSCSPQYPRKSWTIPSNDEYIHIQPTGTQNRSLPEKKTKWKHSYKSQANHITDTRKLIKTSWLSYEHRKNHIKHVYIAWDMSDKGQQGFEPQLYGINVDIQSSVVKQRSLVTQSIYLRIPLRQCFKTRLGLFIYLNIWKSFYWLLIRKVWISEQNTTEIVINF